MKTLKALLVATISFLCVHTANAQQQCGQPSYSETYQDNTPDQQCPASGPTAIPYTIVGLSITGTASFFFALPQPMLRLQTLLVTSTGLTWKSIT